MELWQLFLSAFISSTIMPGGSEAIIAYMAAQKLHPVRDLLAMATLGNTLGAMTTWALGTLAARKFPLESKLSAKQRKALNTLRNRGIWVLFFSWLPIVGDVFCFAAGWLKLPLLLGASLILAGKFCRYLAITWFFI